MQGSIFENPVRETGNYAPTDQCAVYTVLSVLLVVTLTGRTVELDQKIS